MNDLKGKGAVFTVVRPIDIPTNRTGVDQMFYDSKLDSVVVRPGEPMFAAMKTKYKLGEFFVSSDLYNAERRLEALRNDLVPKGTVLKICFKNTAPGIGDVIMSTIVPKAFKEAFGKEVIIHYCTTKELAVILKGNPHIDKLIFDEQLFTTKNYHLLLDMNTMEFKMEPSFEEKSGKPLLSRSAYILNRLNLWLVDRTPIFVLSKKEISWAREYMKQYTKEVIGVQQEASCKARTYKHTTALVKKIHDLGYDCVVLDKKTKSGKYKFKFREAVAIANECDIVIAPDSALLHAAGALKKRIIGLFGHTDGGIFTEDYEKAIAIQGWCVKDREYPCWWTIPCVKGSSLKEKSKSYVPCLSIIQLISIQRAICSHFVIPEKILVTMLTYNNLNMTKKALASIRSFHNYDIFVVDNESDDGTPEWLQKSGYDFVSKKSGVGEAQNIAIKKTLEGDYAYLLLLNNDIVLRGDYIDEIIKAQQRTGGFAVAGTVLEKTPPWSVDRAVIKKGVDTKVVAIEAGDYSATLLPRKCLETIGYFDEQFAPRYIEDNDYTLRIRLSGNEFYRTTSAQYYHALGAVVHSMPQERNKHEARWNRNFAKFQAKWGISPHAPQTFSSLGQEWYSAIQGETIIESITALVEKAQPIRVGVARQMGGFGDVLFSTAIARALKTKFGKNIIVEYSVPQQFAQVLLYNSDIDVIHIDHKPKQDFSINITDLEFRVELQEIQKYGRVVSPRTKIYLDLLGVTGELKPIYTVIEKEKLWAQSLFKNGVENLVCVSREGSNFLKKWPHMDALLKKLSEKYTVYVFDEKKTTFRQAAAIASIAKCVISPDTGISNVASALNVPTITLFSNRNGEIFEKMFTTMIPVQGNCPHQERDFCDFETPCFGMAPHREKENIACPDCLKRLTVEKVLGEVRRNVR